MSNIKLDITKAACFLEAGAVKAFEPKVKAAQEALEKGRKCRSNREKVPLRQGETRLPSFLHLRAQGLAAKPATSCSPGSNVLQQWLRGCFFQGLSFSRRK